MSCGQIALRELGIIPEVYYASEIDKPAIGQAQLNFPETVQLGDVTKWREWNIDWSRIDIVFAGSPCQGFSFAGKQLAFNDPRSALFFVFVDILKHCRKHNPEVFFLLENVNMKKEYLRVISECVGLFPVNINSNLVSAQNRNRWYWTNIRTKQMGLFGEVHTDIPQPTDRGIFLLSILQHKVPEKYYLPGKTVANLLNRGKRLKTGNDKGGCITGSSGHGAGYRSDMDLIAQTPRGRNNLIIQLNPSKEIGGKQPYQQNRIYSTFGKAPALMTGLSCGPNVATYFSTQIGKSPKFHNENSSGKSYCVDTRASIGVGFKYEHGNVIRRLTPNECSRLQTIPEWYVWKCSETQIYRMLGNGWTIEVIKHILSFLPPKFLNKQ